MKTQQDRVLAVLKRRPKGGIDKLYAARILWIFGLGEVIRKLRMKGHKIETTWIQREGKRPYARYILRSSK